MTEQNQNKKALWIFPNFKESIDELPKSQRALVWQAVCEIGLGYDFDIKKCTTSQKMCIKMIYPLLKLRNIGGSITEGEKRNPSGKNGLNNCNKTIPEDNPYPNPLDNPMDNPEDNSLYKKEIRNKEQENKKEIKEESITISSDKSSDMVVKINEILTKYGLAKIRELTNERKSKLKERCKSVGGFENFLGQMEIALAESSFLRGFNDKGWQADFDFFLQKSSWQKILEGKYKDKPMWKNIDAKPNAFEIFNQAMDEIERRVAQ